MIKFLRRRFVQTALLGGAGWALATAPISACFAGDAGDAVAASPSGDETLKAAGAAFNLYFSDGFDAAARLNIRAWVTRSAMAVAAYLGRFPIDSLDVYLNAQEGTGVRSGFTSFETEVFVRLRLGVATSPAELLDDWILVHEMLHVAMPRLVRRHNWLHEGMATYVEGVVRARAGITSASYFWDGLRRSMSQGLPKPDDQGLDNTRTWSNTYWGGAIFCLLADVKIRQQSQLRLGLQQALQGILAAGGNYAVQWPVEEVLAKADAAVGLNVLSLQYQQMRDNPMRVDLPALWAELGVLAAAPFNDAAPLAAVRRAIVS
jgi:hypothetical protein